jgi:hypothetical protein
MIYMVDIDGTICDSINGDYNNAVPKLERIAQVNFLFDSGHEIHYWTARGARTGLNWNDLTSTQLKNWGCKYTSFNMKKPSYDVWIDDNAINSEDFFA